MKNECKYVLPSLKEAGKRRTHITPIIRERLVVPEELLSFCANKKYFIRTYGCQANERDGEFIAGILEKCGYQKATTMREADFVILNTCAVRENAEDKVFGIIGTITHLKKQKPNLLFAICGCMIQEEAIVDRILKKYRCVDLLFGTHNINRLPALLLQAYRRGKRVVEVFSKEGEIYECLPSKRASNIKAWVNITYGCDKFCTYCIVPYTRGKERSRLPEDILNEVKDLAKLGYKEITLLGQNVDAYGLDLHTNYEFADLLNDVAKIGIPRVRFLTSHPWNFTDATIAAIKNNKNVMPYVHLPLQSGADNILRKMGRRYTSAEYKNLFDRIKKEIPNVCVTTDIIVGFPNETEEEFAKTLDMVNYCRFDGAYTFIYSPREGTPAAKFVDEVSAATKHERFDRLLELVNRYSLESNEKCLNKTLKVLVDGPSKKNPHVLTGYTETNKVVNFPGDESLIGRIVDVKIVGVKSFSLEGEYRG